MEKATAQWILSHGATPFGIYESKPSPPPCIKEASPEALLTASPSPGTSATHSDDDTHSRGSPSSLKENVDHIKMETDDQLAGTSCESSVPITKPLKVEIDDSSDRILAAKIHQNAKFHSFAEFHSALEAWKRVGFHNFRIASSEKMKSADQALMDRVYYRYVVYHCAHYGPPRMRGDGHRPNQNYLPCGCRAMMRLNYSHEEDVLRLTSLTDTHSNHEVSSETFNKLNGKTRRSHAQGDFGHSPLVTPKQKTPESSPSSTSPPAAAVPLQTPAVSAAPQWSPPLLGSPSLASLIALQQQQMLQRQQAALDMLALQRSSQPPTTQSQILPLLQNFLGLPSPNQQSPPMACLPPVQSERPNPKPESARIPEGTPIDLSLKIAQPIAQNPTQSLEATQTLNKILMANEKSTLLSHVITKLSDAINRTPTIEGVRMKVGQLNTLVNMWDA